MQSSLVRPFIFFAASTCLSIAFVPRSLAQEVPFMNTLQQQVSRECLEYLGYADTRSLAAPEFMRNHLLNLDNDSSEPGRKIIEKLTRPHFQWSVLWENDSFTIDDYSDEHYTNGIKLSWLNNPCRPGGEARKSVISTYIADPAYSVYAGGTFGMNMYTPQNITTTQRQRNDRPFVGWLYFGWNALALRRDEDRTLTAHSVEWQIGVTGPSSAQGRIQAWWHDDVGTSPFSPAGWPNQTEDRLGINLLWTSRQSHYFCSGKLRVTPHAGFSVGNIATLVNIGGMVSIGNPSDDYPGLTIQPAFLGNSSSAARYVFFGVDGRWIARSVFIEGYGDVQHDIELENFVYDTMLGVAYQPDNSHWKFSFMVIERSREFDSPDDSLEDSHSILQMSLSSSF